MRTYRQPQAFLPASVNPLRCGAMRVLAALAAALLLATTLGQVAHFLLVRHVVCAEHGELVEAPLRVPRGHVAPEQKGKTASEREPALEHEHCEVLARQQRQTALLSDAPVALSSAPPQLRIDAETPARLAPSLPAPLTRAPKTSPPEARHG
jgi:hypothetical protein